MAPVWMFFIIFAIILAGGIIWGIKTYWENDFLTPIIVMLSGLAVVACLAVGIAQPIAIRNESIRQEKERDQIIFQIENMTEDTDKIKINEWILTYNDWVNDVNTSKETFGWFSWYWSLDMSEHEIINLV